VIIHTSCYRYVCPLVDDVLHNLGWLVWQGIREKKSPALYIAFGSIVLAFYGLVPTLQPSDSFGRTFAVYGGFFIVLSYVWAAALDGFIPDTGDYVGAAIALVGVCITWFWPRP
jgi:drug/metabolite transporter superfamily protein YnfA